MKKTLIAGLILLAVSAHAVSASFWAQCVAATQNAVVVATTSATAVWTAATSGAWTTTGNWLGGAVPSGVSTSITIYSNTTVVTAGTVNISGGPDNLTNGTIIARGATP